MRSERIEGDPAHVVDEGGFEHPYKLTYAASAGAVDDETGEADGAWIIWLPDGCLVIDGETVDLTANLTAANNYPSGWYDITDVFDGTDPDDFDLYLDASKDDPKFVIDPDDAENPVLIASVDGKAVKGIVESAIIIGERTDGVSVDRGGDEEEHAGALQLHDFHNSKSDVASKADVRGSCVLVRTAGGEGESGRALMYLPLKEVTGDDEDGGGASSCNDWSDDETGPFGGSAAGSTPDEGNSWSGFSGEDDESGEGENDWSEDDCGELNGWNEED